MNEIELRMEDEEVRIRVDGRDLVDVVREIELPQATADGQPQIAGTYRGLAAWQWEGFPDVSGDGHAALLGCECGEVGCWPLEARISRQGDTVVWSDFRQPYRENWDFSALGPFVFPAARYDAALAAITAEAERIAERETP
jgi:hypothetical protein